MSLHRGGPLIEQSPNLMKTQISHLEAKITFNLFTNNCIFKHLNWTTIPCESNNYNVQTFHCRVCHPIIDENVSDDDRTDIIFIKYHHICSTGRITRIWFHSLHLLMFPESLFNKGCRVKREGREKSIYGGVINLSHRPTSWHSQHKESSLSTCSQHKESSPSTSLSL